MGECPNGNALPHSAEVSNRTGVLFAGKWSHVLSSASMSLRLTQSVYRDTKGICQRELAVVLH